MISYTQSTIGDYKVFCANMELGDVLSITLENPQPEQHTHKNSMVVSGQMRISIKEYSTVVKTGDNAKFRPRAGLTPFDVGDVVVKVQFCARRGNTPPATVGDSCGVC